MFLFDCNLSFHFIDLELDKKKVVPKVFFLQPNFKPKVAFYIIINNFVILLFSSNNFVFESIL